MHNDFVLFRFFHYIKVMGISAFLKTLKTKIFCRETTILYQLGLNEYDLTINPEVSLVIEDVNNRNVEDARSMVREYLIGNFKTLLESGETGYYGYHNGKVVGRAWVIERPGRVPIFLDFAHYDLKDKEILIHYCETRKDFRGKKIYPFTLNYISLKFKERGYENAYIAVSKRNVPSNKGVIRVGFKPILEQVIWVVLGFKFITQKNLLNTNFTNSYAFEL